MTFPDFSCLTPSQRQLLDNKGWNIFSGVRAPKLNVVRKLIRRRLLVERPIESRFGSITQYEVPDDVYNAWIEHKS